MSEKTEEGCVAAPVAEAAPHIEADQEKHNFPKINRRVWDVFYDDERNEIWVGIKARASIKGRTKENGPVEDIEVNLDPLSVVTSLDAAKQDVLIALGKDQQSLMEKRARVQALKGNGILNRLTEGLGRAVGSGKSLLTR